MVLATLGLSLLATAAQAQTTIYDTIGDRTSFTFAAYVIGPNPYNAIAQSFSVSSAASFSSVSLFLDKGDVSNYTVELTYPGATQPGAVIDSWNVYGSDSLITLNSRGSDFLGVGNYDIVVSSDSSGAWSINGNYQGSIQFYGPYGWTIQPTGALPEMKVQVTPAATPEPSTVAVMGVGAIGMFLRRRSARKARLIV
jgi:hypothetical protein